MKILARIISDITNPLLISIPTSYLLVYKVTNNNIYSLKWAVLSFVFSAITAIFVFIGVKSKLFSDFDVSVRLQRTVLYLFASCIAFLYLVTILILNGPKVLLVGTVTMLLGIVIASIVNKYLKASVHVAVFSAFSFSMSILYGGLYWAGVLFIPVVAWARIQTKRHTCQETVAGGTLGILVISVVFIIARVIIFKK